VLKLRIQDKEETTTNTKRGRASAALNLIGTTLVKALFLAFLDFLGLNIINDHLTG
jgi:hypothetical protein